MFESSANASDYPVSSSGMVEKGERRRMDPARGAAPPGVVGVAVRSTADMSNTEGDSNTTTEDDSEDVGLICVLLRCGVCVCVRVCVHACVQVCVHVCACRYWIVELLVETIICFFLFLFFVLGNLTFADILTPTPQHAHTHRHTYTHTLTLTLSLSLYHTHTHTHTLSHAHMLTLSVSVICQLFPVQFCSIQSFFFIMIGFSFLSTLHFFYFFPLFC